MPEDHPMIHDMKLVLQEFGAVEDLLWKHKVSDASYFQIKGIPSLAFGPGAAAGSSYLPNEYNILTQLSASKKIYKEILHRMCQ